MQKFQHCTVNDALVYLFKFGLDSIHPHWEKRIHNPNRIRFLELTYL